MPEMKGLSPEAIEALLNKSKPKTKTEPKIRHTETSVRPPLKSQIGPIRSVNDRGYCQSGHWSEHFQQRFECKVPTYTQFQGIYYCNLHALHLANEMLVAKGVLS